MRIGLLLRQHRAAEKLTLRELADDIGIDDSNLSRIERGQQCNIKFLAKLLAWLFS